LLGAFTLIGGALSSRTTSLGVVSPGRGEGLPATIPKGRLPFGSRWEGNVKLIKRGGEKISRSWEEGGQRFPIKRKAFI